MKKIELAIVFGNSLFFLAIAILLLTGHSGFASKTANVFFFLLLAQLLSQFLKR